MSRTVTVIRPSSGPAVGATDETAGLATQEAVPTDRRLSAAAAALAVVRTVLNVVALAADRLAVPDINATARMATPAPER